VNKAVFLDRDGTIVHDPGYLATPSDVVLLAGVAEALRRLEAAGWLRIVVTNQSGIGRRLFDASDYERVEQRIADLLAATGASLTASYHCPHRPEDGCACRKPGTALHERAAREHDIDLAGSWWIGDRMSDLLPAGAFGGQALLVLTGEGPRHEEVARAAGFGVAENLQVAVEQVLDGKREG
jgi:histidinol-phosphate phosphatase family protein